MYRTYVVDMIRDANDERSIDRQARDLVGRCAAPSLAVAVSTGTRSRIFSFYRFSRTSGLNKPGKLAKGAAQNLPKIASNLPQADYPLAPLLKGVL